MRNVTHGWRAMMVATLLVVTMVGALSACGSTSYAPDGPYLHEVIRTASERQHKPYAIFLCTASDVSAIPFPPDYYRRLFLKDGQGTGNIYDYYLNMSYGSIDLDGSVVAGPFTMKTSKAVLDTRNQSPSAPGHRIDTLNDCMNAASAAGWNGDKLKPFVGFVAAINIKTDGGQASNNAIVIDPYSFPSFIEHEMGHALGLQHSMVMAADTTGVHQWSPGGDNNYNDCWDIMSAFTCTFRFMNRDWGVSGPELEAIYRDQRGWMPQDRVYTYGSGSQTVFLNAVSEPRGSAYLLAKIPVGSKGVYTVEFRRRSGWDLGIPHDAVLIHEYRNSTISGQTDSLRSFIVARGTSQSWLPGQVFQDTANRVRIRINTFAAGAASITISQDVSTAPDKGTGGDTNCGVVQGNKPGRIPPVTAEDGFQGMAIIQGCDPIVHITAPGAPAAKFDGSPTTLRASVASPAGDAITDRDIVWTEVVAGNPVELGRGRTISAKLPRGVHAITVTATDTVLDTTGSDSTTYSLCDEALCTPKVVLNSPADGTHVRAGVPFIVSATVVSPTFEGAAPKVVWTVNNVYVIDGGIGTFGQTFILNVPGTNTLALSATTPLLGYVGSAQLTLIVDPPSATPSVSILSPVDGTWYYEVAPPGQPVHLAAVSSDSSMTFVWTDTYDLALHALATGATADVTLPLPASHTANCAEMSHVIKVTGTTADKQTATATVTVFMRATCIR